MIGSIQKSGQILELFSREQPEWGLSEMCKVLEMPKTTVSDLLMSLCAVGLLHKTNEARYRLGWRVAALNRVLMEGSEMRVEAERIMEQLVRTFGETVHLAALERTQVVYLAKQEGTKSVQVRITGVGTQLPPHASSLGKVLLCELPWEEVETLIGEGGLSVFTHNTITTLDELKSELAITRSRGFGYDIEEAAEELCCVAAPIRNAVGDIVAALSFSVPAYRFHPMKRTLVRCIVEAAQEVSYRLGYDERSHNKHAKHKKVTL